MKKIIFTHLTTGEQVEKLIEELDHKFNNPRISKMVVWSYTDDCIMDIEKSTIISIEDMKDGKGKKHNK